MIEPGPWECVSTSNHAHDYRLSLPGGSMPYAAPCNDHSQARANARLIAAAPALLDELNHARRLLGRIFVAALQEDFRELTQIAKREPIEFDDDGPLIQSAAIALATPDKDGTP